MFSTIKYKNISIDILRLDEMHLPVGGNKFYKLKYNLKAAKNQNHHTLLTFGGAFSNHVYATALAGKLNGLKTIGVIRGEDDELNPTLSFCREQNMHVHFVNRETYSRKDEPGFLSELQNRFGKFYVLPEGGTNLLAVEGTKEILATVEKNYDLIFCAAGTGGTLAGIISAAPSQTKIIGISVLKGDDTLTGKVSALIPAHHHNWQIQTQYHLGGYAKYNYTLMQFIHQFTKNYHMRLDPVYTGKALYAVFQKIDAGEILPHQHILAIHTGGLQGWNGWNYRYKKN